MKAQLGVSCLMTLFTEGCFNTSKDEYESHELLEKHITLNRAHFILKSAKNVISKCTPGGTSPIYEQHIVFVILCLQLFCSLYVFMCFLACSWSVWCAWCSWVVRWTPRLAASTRHQHTRQHLEDILSVWCGWLRLELTSTGRSVCHLQQHCSQM